MITYTVADDGETFEWPILYISRKEIYACSGGLDSSTGVKQRDFKKEYKWYDNSMKAIAQIKRWK